MLRSASGLTGGQVGARLQTAFRSGQRVGLPTAGGATTTNAVSADTMYAWPIPMPYGASISGVAAQVGTAVVGVSGKLGLAYCGVDGWPGELIAEAPTPVDMNSSANFELVSLFAAAENVRAGYVWGLSVFNGAAKPVTVAGFASMAILPGHIIGPTHIGSYTLNGGTGPRVSLVRAHTYASAFPATLTGWSSGGAPSSPVMVAIVA